MELLLTIVKAFLVVATSAFLFCVIVIFIFRKSFKEPKDVVSKIFSEVYSLDQYSIQKVYLGTAGVGTPNNPDITYQVILTGGRVLYTTASYPEALGFVQGLRYGGIK